VWFGRDDHGRGQAGPAGGFLRLSPADEQRGRTGCDTAAWERPRRARGAAGTIAARTAAIRLTSAVTVLSVLDPVRVYQDFATVDLISSGRAEIIAGRSAFPGAVRLVR
jgi:Luciferase-like monooxygenase